MTTNLLLFLQAIKQAPVPPGYVFNEKLGRYLSAKTGRFVPTKTILKLLDGNEAVTQTTLNNLSQALRKKDLDLPAWNLAMQQQLSRLHVQNAVLGAGGFDALKPRDFARIDAALRSDWDRLLTFGTEIANGNLSEKQIAARVAMYAGHARTQFYASQPKPITKAGQVIIERRVLRAGDNCSWCVYLANLGWQPFGTLPLPGESGAQWQEGQCFTNCRCDLERKAVKRSEANALTRPLTSFFAPNYSYGNIIKGGEGSGNHDHKGRKGKRGGSADDGIPNGQANAQDVPPGYERVGTGWRTKLRKINPKANALVDDMAGSPKKPKVLPDKIAAKKPTASAPSDAPEKAPKVAGSEGLSPIKEKFKIPKTTESPVDDALAAGDHNSDPLLTMYAGKRDKNQTIEQYMESAKLRVKDEAATVLSEGAGISKLEANDFIKQWLVTSNDSDLASLRVQDLAAAEFGSNLTKWQQSNIRNIKAKRSIHLDGALERIPDSDKFDAKEAAQKIQALFDDQSLKVALPFERRALLDLVAEQSGPKKTRIKNKADFLKRLAAIEAESEEKTKRALRFTYEETQRRLAAEGITELRVFRGASLSQDETFSLSAGDSVEVESNALSSWSFARSISENYAVRRDMTNTTGGRQSPVIFDAVIPASRIFATALTGPASVSQWEIVVMGAASDYVRVYKAHDEDIKSFRGFGQGHKRSDIIKGGEGSGNHGHRGRPGERGGSAGGGGRAREDLRNPTKDDSPVDDALENFDYGADPLVAMYVGEQDKGRSMGDWLEAVRKQRKHDIATALSEGTDLTYDEANEFIKQWSISSNDHDMASIHIQEAAAEMFGGNLTDYQLESLRSVEAARKDALGLIFEDLPDDFQIDDPAYMVGRVLERMDKKGAGIALPFEQRGLRGLLDDLQGSGGLSKAELQGKFAEIQEASRAKVEQALAFTYEETQRKLAAEGITELHLFRGAALTPDDTFGMIVGEKVAVTSNPLSSWSFSRETAAGFADGMADGFFSRGGRKHAVLVDAVVPASRVYATAVTGQGCLTEWEIIVLGTAQDTVRVYGIDDDKLGVSRMYNNPYKARVIKGGEGSGNHGHKGRKGERGGSADDGIPNESARGRVRAGSEAESAAGPKRVWQGKQHEGESALSKLETGALGEQAAIDAMSEMYGVPFGTVNVKVNNAPFDVVGDHTAIEVKTGLATNGQTAQVWRATIGQPGKAEAELLKTMDAESKRIHNEWKMKAILDRKHNLLDKMSKEAGQPMKPKTVCLIMAPDGSAADMYSYEGFHLRLPWRQNATDEHFLGTYDFKNKKMHWKEGGAPTKAAPNDEESSLNLESKRESLLNLMGGAGDSTDSELQEVTLSEIDADFEAVFKWWTAHHDPEAGTIKRGRIIKGGPGSGYHAEDGHEGRQGKRGGSSSDGNNGPDSEPGATADKPTGRQPKAGYVAGEAITIDSLDIAGKGKRSWPMDRDNMNDLMLDSIYRKQGFDGLPEAVDPDQFDALLAGGDIGVELHRGEWNTNKSTAAQTIDQFINGRHTVGKGIFGNGTYASKSAKEAGTAGGRKADGMLRMGLRKGAKVMGYDQLLAHMEKQPRGDPYRQGKSITEALTNDEAMAYMNGNPGRIAAFLGYDAIQTRSGQDYIILNRTAVYVEKKRK